MRLLTTILPVLFLTLAPLSADASPVFNPDNGHTYEYVDAELYWVQARDAASAASDATQRCYLATLTSPAEDAFVLTEVLPPQTEEFEAWLGARHGSPGACRDDDASSWGGLWVTGESWGYTNWRPDEPEPGECIELCVGYANDPGAGIGWENAFCEFEDGLDADEQDRQPYVVECEPLGRMGCGSPGHCGDGALDAGETCDDGNTIAGDGCTACEIDAVCPCIAVWLAPPALPADLSNATCELATFPGNVPPVTDLRTDGDPGGFAHGASTSTEEDACYSIGDNDDNGTAADGGTWFPETAPATLPDPGSPLGACKRFLEQRGCDFGP